MEELPTEIIDMTEVFADQDARRLELVNKLREANLQLVETIRYKPFDQISIQVRQDRVQVIGAQLAGLR